MNANSEAIVGRVLRASTRGFDCGAHSRNISDRHNFGAFVKAPITNDMTTYAVGLIYKVEIKDDQLISELVMGELVPDNILRDQRDNRMIPVEIKVLNVGYFRHDNPFEFIASLPPRPPMSLADVWGCTPEEVFAFTQQLDFVRIIMGASEVPSDDLIAAALWSASDLYESREEFMMRAGQRLARELSHDLKRLSHVLSLIRPTSA